MAIVRAVKTGNWSDPTVWNTGALPTAADDVYSNTFTVTVDVSPTVLSISNAAASGVTAGGSFVPTNGITLSVTGANGIINGGQSIATLVSSLTSGQSFIVNGNVTAPGNGGPSGGGIRNTSSGSVVVVGNVTGAPSNGNFGYGIVNPSNGTILVTGNVSAGTGNGGLNDAILNSGTGTVNISGTVTGGWGNNTGGGAGITNSSSGTVNITGSCVGGTNTPALLNSGTGVAVVTGTANANTSAALANTSSGSLTHVGSAQSTNTSAAVTSSNYGATNIFTGPFLTSSNGASAIYVARWFWQNTTPPATYYQIRTANLATIRPLYTADSVGGNPATSNVRSGTIFGPNNELTGTCAVPPAASVGVGVPVDNTTGTAALTAANIRAALGMASANLDNQLDALPTTAEIAQAVWEYTTRTLSSVSEIVSAVWSATTRTITGGTVDTLTNAPTVPTPTEIASQVRTELSTELARIDAATSTRLAAADYDAPLDAAGTRAAVGLASANLDTQLNALPTAAENATAVRSELATELGRLDATVSSRLAPAGTLARVTLVDTTTTVTNSSQVDNAAIADAVRTELQPELARVANCSTTQEVGDIVEEAMNP